MMAFNKSMILLSEKLGLSEEENILRKAAEFERLLVAKNTPGLKLTDTSRIVMCLDLAADCLGLYIDKVSVIKYSGLRSTVYLNYRKTVQNLLQLNTEKLTIKQLCRLLQCNGHIEKKAQELLEAYHDKSKMEIDIDSAQYICMAVFQACRLSNEKISKSKLIQKSDLKPAQWAKLEDSWKLFINQNHVTMEKEDIKPSQEADTILTENSKLKSTYKVKRKVETVPYDVWEKEMLEKATKYLREQVLNGEIAFNEYMKEYRDCVDDNFHKSILKDLKKQQKNNENVHSKETASPQKRTKELCDQIPKIVITSPRKSPRKNVSDGVNTSKRETLEKLDLNRQSLRQSPRKLNFTESKSEMFASYLCGKVSPRKRVNRSSEELVLSFNKVAKKINL